MLLRVEHFLEMELDFADVAVAHRQREHQVGVALVGPVGDAVLERGGALEQELRRGVQSIGRGDNDRDAGAVGHAAQVAAVLVHFFEPNPVRLPAWPDAARSVTLAKRGMRSAALSIGV